MTTKGRNIAYWITTILVAFFIGSGGIAQVAHLRASVDGFVHILGYPAYFVTVLGVWKVLGPIAILVPRFPRLKEWAYAGIFFDLTGAVASNAAVHGSAFHILVPLVLAGIAMASWWLRPPTRVVGTLFPATKGGTVEQSSVSASSARA
ncbi:MAG TPA: DoxX family protein [Bryocella sp.]|nr:DoxX family protein [Bryocella sp.]